MQRKQIGTLKVTVLWTVTPYGLEPTFQSNPSIKLHGDTRQRQSPPSHPHTVWLGITTETQSAGRSIRTWVGRGGVCDIYQTLSSSPNLWENSKRPGTDDEKNKTELDVPRHSAASRRTVRDMALRRWRRQMTFHLTAIMSDIDSRI